MRELYKATMTNIGGRDGKVYSPDGKFSFKVATPESMSGKPSDDTNPEQLFAAGYSSCFNGALNLVLRKNKVKFKETKVTADVSLLEDPADGGFLLAVKMVISIDGLSLDETARYAELAHTVCPYSKAVSGNIDVELKVV